MAIVGTIFFGQLGSASGAASYGDAFSLTLGVQAAFALTAAVLVSRARRTTEEVGAMVPADGHGGQRGTAGAQSA